MTREDFGIMLERLAAGWTERNYRAVLNEFVDDLYYADPLNYTFRDKESLLSFFRNDDGKPQKCTFHRFAFDEAAQIGAAEYTYTGTHRYYGTVWIEIVDDKIKSWREYQHKTEPDRGEFWDTK